MDFLSKLQSETGNGLTSVKVNGNIAISLGAMYRNKVKDREDYDTELSADTYLFTLCLFVFLS